MLLLAIADLNASLATVDGSYTPAWFTAGGLCLVAAVAVLVIPVQRRGAELPA